MNPKLVAALKQYVTPFFESNFENKVLSSYIVTYL